MENRITDNETTTNKSAIAMNLREFSKANLDRCESPGGFNHPLESWTTSDWFTAVVGGLGEAANIAKKINRVRDGIPGNAETPVQLRLELARELADTFIYLDLLAQSVGVDLSDIVPKVFDAKSETIGYEAKLEAEHQFMRSEKVAHVPKLLTTGDLPSFEDCGKAKEENRASKLQNFIWQNEPSSEAESNAFRFQLVGLINEQICSCS